MDDQEFVPWTEQQVDEATKAQIDVYIEERIKEYTDERAAASALHELWQADFENFTVSAYRKSTETTKSLRDFLRTRNVFVSKARGLPIATQLIVSRKGRWRPMPDDQLHEVIADYRPIFPSRAQPRASSQERPPNDATRNHINTLTSISKLYTEDQKYSGSQSESFDSKLRTFQTYCDMCNIPTEERNKAFIFMLKGAAIDHYHNLCKADQELPSLEEFCRSIKITFEGPEHQQLMLAKWNQLTLQTIIDRSENKDVDEALNKLITSLRSIQQNLHPLFRNDPFLHAKLLAACRDHPACSMACILFSPNNDVAELTNRLKSNVATWKAISRPHLTQPFQQPTPDQFLQREHDSFFTDRRYNGARFNTPHQQRFGTNNNNNGYNRRRFNNDVKSRPRICFVCRKENCWSTRHSDEERMQAKQRLRSAYNSRNQKFLSELDFDERFDSYVQDFEGMDPDQDLAEDFDIFLSIHNNDHENFHTSCGDVGAENARNLYNDLVNEATKHAVTAHIGSSNNSHDNIDEVFMNNARYNDATFHGILIDTGAAGHSTAGKQQVQAYERLFGHTAINTSQQICVKFGIGTTTSIGTINIDTPIGNCVFHVVDARTPFLLSLQDLDNKRIILDNINNQLLFSDNERTVPVTRRFGHAFMQWGSMATPLAESYLTEEELRTLHRRFGHPSTRRLVNLLNRAGHHDTSHHVILDRIMEHCTRCQKHGGAPLRFKFKLRDCDNMDFNHNIFVDIMWIEGSPVLHVVDEATRFQAARWLNNMTSTCVWDALRTCWIDTYVGPPDRVTHDAGTNLRSSEFKQYCTSLGISMKEIPVEAAHSMGIIERYHKPLRRAYKVIEDDLRSANMNKTMILQMAVKAINDTAGPDGLVPTLLVFGTYPRMTPADAPAPSILARATAIHKAMFEVTKLRSQRQIDEAVQTRNGPRTTDIAIGADVLVWRVHRRQWEGPFKLISLINETAMVMLPSGPTSFRSTSIKPYTPEDSSLSLSSTAQRKEPQIAPNGLRAPHSAGASIESGNHHRSKDNGDENSKDNNEPRPRRKTRLPERLRDPDITVYVNDDTVAAPNFTASRQKELDGLMQRGVFQFVDAETVPRDVRIFNSRFVDQIKFKGTPQAFEKSRLVIQAYNDTGKDGVLTQAPTIQRASQRLLLSIAVMKNLPIYSRDISQAYTQSKTTLARDIFAKPPKELNLPYNTIMKVLLPLYGIPEAGTHWYNTYHRHHINKLGLRQTASDPCLLYGNETFEAIVALQTDDTLFACDKGYLAKEEAELEKAQFSAKPIDKLTPAKPLDFNGAALTIDGNDGTIKVTQSNQCQKLSTINYKGTDRSHSQYVSQRARGAYISSVCQPQAAFELSIAAQTTKPEPQEYRRLNKCIQWQIDNMHVGLRFVKLVESQLRIVVFTDSSFANNADHSSQIGFVIVLADDEHCNLVTWSSTKCKRITRSVLASELYAMVSGFDAACVLKHTIDSITKRSIPLIICIDSYSLYECMVKLGTTREKRLMIDICALRQAYERREIAEVVWINGSSNPADAMTKRNGNKALSQIIKTNTYRLDRGAWVDRPAKCTDDIGFVPKKELPVLVHTQTETVRPLAQ